MRAIYLGCLAAAGTWGAVSTQAGEPSGAAARANLIAAFIEGSSVYSAKTLSETYATHLGTPLSRESVAGIASAIETRYRRDGFIAAVITTMDDGGGSGTPGFLVHEAGVSQVRVRGDAGPNHQSLLQYAAAIEAMRPLHRERIRQTLDAMRRLPGVGLRASFTPDPQQINQFILDLEVAWHPMGASMSLSNRGSRASGRNIVSGRLLTNGLLRQEEFLSLEGAASTAFDQYHYFGAALTRAAAGGWASVNYSTAKAQPWAASDFFDRDRYALQFLRLFQGRHLVATATARLVATDSLLRNEDFGPLSRENLRKIEAGFGLASSASDSHRSRISATLVRGIGGLGARSVSYDGLAAPDVRFTRALVSSEQSFTLSHQTVLTGRLEGAYSFDGVPGSEQFTFGGSRFGAGLEPADLAGESGAALALNVSRTLKVGSAWLDSWTLYSGVDYGRAWKTNTGYARDDAGSSSVGIELENARFTTSLELAYPWLRPEFTETREAVRAFIDFSWSF